VPTEAVLYLNSVRFRRCVRLSLAAKLLLCGRPQIMNFLLNGEYEQSRELERFLLAKCSRFGPLCCDAFWKIALLQRGTLRRSLRFAHRMHWYLSSHASTSGYMSEARQRSSATGGIVPVPLLQAVDIYGSWAGTNVAFA
jgi:hypothetical protein